MHETLSNMCKSAVARPVTRSDHSNAQVLAQAPDPVQSGREPLERKSHKCHSWSFLGGSRKPCAVFASKYTPTMLPSELIPNKCVLRAPGISTDVNLPF